MADETEYLHVASAADENYALPLAVTIRSMLDHIDLNVALRIHIIDGGISAETKQRLLRSWRHPGLVVNWIPLDEALLADLPVSGHVTRVAYARLLLPSLLPSRIARVIYLDSDLLVRRNLAPLWRQPHHGSPCFAAVDVAAPRLDAELVLSNYAACGPHLASARPIPNYRALGLDPRAHYFNSGIMHLDLRQWRAEGISQQALECLTQNAPHVQWWDQYALNVVLYGRWRPLDIRWNQGAQVYQYPSHAHSPLDRASYLALVRQPWIVHFSSPHKPWHWGSRHPYRRQFFRTLDRTSWRGWRPAAPYEDAREWLQIQYGQLKTARLALSRRLKIVCQQQLARWRGAA